MFPPIDKGVYNKVKLFYNNRKSGARDIYTAYDRKNAEKWGVLQYTGSLKEGENGQAKAEELVKLIKKAAVAAVEAEKPAAVYFGKVTDTAPLRIFVDQRFVLGENIDQDGDGSRR